MTPERLRQKAKWAQKEADICGDGTLQEHADQLRAHAAALEEIERLKAGLAAQSVKLKADEIAWHEQEESIRDLRAERDALKRHAEAMADAIQFGDMAILTVAKAAADSYRSDYPKDPK